MIKAVIFDFGGVIVRTEDQRPRTVMADALGKTYAELEYLVFNSESGRAAQLGQITHEQNWENLGKALTLRRDEIGYAQMAFFGGDVLDVELVAYIRKLRESYRVALLSNYSTILREELLDKWKIADLFDPIVLSADVGLMKPNPDIYLHILERMGLEASETVFIDDFLHNIQGARSVGMHGIVFQSRSQLIQELEELLEGIRS